VLPPRICHLPALRRPEAGRAVPLSRLGCCLPGCRPLARSPEPDGLPARQAAGELLQRLRGARLLAGASPPPGSDLAI